MDVERSAAQLMQLGLTAYEAKTYVALTRRGSTTAAEAARLAQVPRQRIYDVLASLVDKGLAVSRPGRVVRYAPSAPATAVEGLLARRRREVTALEETAEAILAELEPAYDAGQAQTEPLEYIEVLRDRRASGERLRELTAAAEREILAFLKPPYPTSGRAPGRSRRVTSYTLCERSAIDDADVFAALRRTVEAGAQVRLVPELPVRLVLVDGAAAVVGLDDPVAGTVEVTTIVVEHAAFVALLRTAFLAVWELGVELPAVGPTPA